MTKLLKSFHLIAVTGAVLSLSIAGVAASAQDQNTKPDNSAQNKNQDQTAQNQSATASDRELTAKVRKAIFADRDLSTYAHNIKIISQNGTVTLKGPVKSDDEKQKIESDAASVVPRDSIVNQLIVTQ